jgi:hypothetical protein
MNYYNFNCPFIFWNEEIKLSQTCLVPNESLYESIAKLSERYLLNLNLTQDHYNKYTVEWSFKTSKEFVKISPIWWLLA